MAETVFSASEFERAMEPLFESETFEDSDFDRISTLLSHFGKNEWRTRPRTYAVLRMIDRIDLLDSFVVEGLRDINFPYTSDQLPPAMNSPAARMSFCRKQEAVLTKAMFLEGKDNRHRHFSERADQHFETVGLLGRGGHGEVHHVRSKLSREEYARKRIHRKKLFSRRSNEIKAFENDISSLKQFSHRHLVQLVGYMMVLGSTNPLWMTLKQTSGVPELNNHLSYTDPKYIVLLISPVADCDLQHFLERSPFPQGDFQLIRGFFGCLCSVILYLHNNKCHHNDLKPGNVLIKDQTIMVTDFGTARDWTGQMNSTTVSNPGPFTPWYAAPEVHNAEKRSSSADIWSLGCIFLDMALILSGSTRNDLIKFLNENGTYRHIPALNQISLQKWLDMQIVQRASLSDGEAEPILWIKKMLCEDRSSRISAAALLSEIIDFRGRYIYYGYCCYDNDSDTASSYQGSVFEVETGLTNIRLESPPAETTPIAVIQSTPDSSVASQSSQITNVSQKVAHSPQISSKTHLHPVPAASSPSSLTSAPSSQPDMLQKAQVIPRSKSPTGKATISPFSNNDKPKSNSPSPGFGKTIVNRYLTIDTEALFTAIDRGDLDQVIFLIGKKLVNFQTTNADGEQALCYAVRNGKKLIVKYFLEKGASPDFCGLASKPLLVLATEQGQRAVVTCLLEAKADLQWRSPSGWTVLHHAAANGHYAIILRLVESGIDTSIQDSGGQNALHVASRKGHTSSAELLVRITRNLVAQDNAGYSALHHAVLNKHESTAKMLIQNGADVSARSTIGLTALHLAAWNGSEPMIKLLLRNGSNVFERDANDESARKKAEKMGDLTTAGLLYYYEQHNDFPKTF